MYITKHFHCVFPYVYLYNKTMSSNAEKCSLDQ